MAGEGHASDAILAFGSNVGDKAGNVARAIELIQADGDVRILRRSRDWRTAPWGVLDQDWFVNACATAATRLAPRELLARCHWVERELGRVRDRRWGPRTIDVDVLFYDGVISDDATLTLPHPRITERAFVLAPLADVAPELVLKGRTVRDWLEATGRDEVKPL